MKYKIIIVLVMYFFIVYNQRLFSNPVQPEFSTFQPSTANNLVNEFDGSLTYSIPILTIPGPDGTSYQLSLVYKSGMSPESEASWVGYGWSLNPGSIIRNVNGFPDDNYDTPITYFNKVEDITNTSINTNASFEVWSNDSLIPLDLNLRLGFILNYNSNYGYEFNVDLGLCDSKTLLGNLTLGSKGGFSGSIYYRAFITDLLQKLIKSKTPKNEFIKNKIINDLVKISNYDLGNFLGYTEEQYRFSEYAFDFSKYRSSGQLSVLGTILWGVGAEAGIGFTQEQILSEKIIKKNSYGFFYNNYSSNFKDDLFDYTSEKDQEFSNRTQFLGIPFANPDYYHLSGESLGGSFRAYNRRINSFKPPTTIGKLSLGTTLGISLDIGSSIGVGFLISGDLYKYQKNGNRNLSFDDNKLQPYIFRFSQDLSQNYDLSNKINDGLLGHSVVSYDLNDWYARPDKIKDNIDEERLRSSCFIGYNTYEQLKNEINQNHRDFEVSKSIRAYNKHHDFISNFSNTRDDYSALSKQIAEFAITNSQGQTYTYGLPVFSRNEADISYGINDIKDIESSGSIIYFKNKGTFSKKMVGQYRKNPYVSMYLLTSIHSDDYIDLNQDGFTSDDFGNYTLFKYKQTAGDVIKSNNKMTFDKFLGINNFFGSSNWLRTRSPRKGFRYNRNTLSDSRDDLASFSTGERENYYLETIETKTHKAIFYTSKRDDSFGISQFDSFNSLKNLIIPKVEDEKLQKLDSIILFSKLNSGTLKVVKRIYFEYNYEIWDGDITGCDGVPESINSGGKLTLKKVWTENYDIREDNISPYIFSYKYPVAPNYYQSGSSFDIFRNYHENLNQTPCFNIDNTDRWGNYRENGETNEIRLNPWVNQVNSNSFDPAAWYLKSINLPTGSTTNIYYEQGKYSKVQDRPAMVMAKLSNLNDSTPLYSSGDKEYRIKLSESGILLTSSDVSKYLDQLKKLFIEKKDKIYFKFLFALYKGSSSISDYANLKLFSCYSEYIDGFVNVKDLKIESGNILVITIANNEIRNMCKDYFLQKKTGNISSFNGNCNFIDPENKSAEDHVKDIINSLTSLVSIDDNIYCNAFSPDNSYFRIPIFKYKLGGGVRVKAIINVDHFTKNKENYPTSNGIEYIYDDEEGYSYGVASNEPKLGSEENSLYYFYHPLKEKSLFNLNSNSLDFSISCDEKEQLTSPIGESVLPIPSVGYSKIVKRNIDNVGNSVGESVKEFYTYEDYPISKEYSVNGNLIKSFSNSELEVEKPNYFNFLSSIFGISEFNIKASQGYQFIINNMNGQPKAEYQYNKYDKNQTPISYTKYDYYQPCEQLPIIYDDLTFSYDYLGRDVEVFEENVKINENNLSLTIDTDFQWVFDFRIKHTKMA